MENYVIPEMYGKDGYTWRFYEIYPVDASNNRVFGVCGRRITSMSIIHL